MPVAAVCPALAPGRQGVFLLDCHPIPGVHFLKVSEKWFHHRPSPPIVRVMSQFQDFLICSGQQHVAPAQQLTDVKKGFVLSLLVQRPLGVLEGRNKGIFLLLSCCLFSLVELIHNLSAC